MKTVLESGECQLSAYSPLISQLHTPFRPFPSELAEAKQIDFQTIEDDTKQTSEYKTVMTGKQK